MAEERKSEYVGLSDSMRVEPITFETTVRGNRRKKVKRFGYLARSVELVTLILTCLFISIQTWAMLQQVETMVEQQRTADRALLAQAQQSYVAAIQGHYQRLFNLLAENEDARKAMGVTIEHVLANVLLSNYEFFYALHKENAFDDQQWERWKYFFKNPMNNDNLQMHRLWSATAYRGLSSDFIKYMAACVYPDPSHLRSKPMNDIVDVQISECPEKVFQ